MRTERVIVVGGGIGGLCAAFAAERRGARRLRHTDPIIARATARMAEVMAEPNRYPIPPREGPRRSELLAILDQEVVPT